jgi:hypothetical protein
VSHSGVTTSGTVLKVIQFCTLKHVDVVTVIKFLQELLSGACESAFKGRPSFRWKCRATSHDLLDRYMHRCCIERCDLLLRSQATSHSEAQLQPAQLAVCILCCILPCCIGPPTLQFMNQLDLNKSSQADLFNCTEVVLLKSSVVIVLLSWQDLLPSSEFKAYWPQIQKAQLKAVQKDPANLGTSAASLASRAQLIQCIDACYPISLYQRLPVTGACSLVGTVSDSRTRWQLVPKISGLTVSLKGWFR